VALTRVKKAMSPVLSTIILVSVTIVVAISSSYWMGALATGQMRSEQLEITSAYAEFNQTLFANGGWSLTVELKNTGSADATITNIFLNAIHIKDYTTGSITLSVNGIQQADLSSINIGLTKGNQVRLLLRLERYNGGTGIQGCTSGTRIDVNFHTAAGMICPLKIKLP